MGVQRQNDGIPAVQVAVHPLDGIGVHVRRGHLHGGGQIHNNRILGCGIHDLHHGVTHLLGVGNLRAGKGLGGVLPAPIRVWVLGGNLLDQLRRVCSQLLNGVLVFAEHHVALQDRCGIVQVHNHIFCALAGFKGAPDQMLTGLHQYLDGHVVGNEVVFDNVPYEIKISLGGRGETHFNLLVAHTHQQFKHAVLALGAHRIDQGLVAVAQVHRTPLRCGINHLVWPGTVGQLDFLHLNLKRMVALHGHRGVALLIPRGLAVGSGAGRGGNVTRGGDKCIRGGHGLKNSFGDWLVTQFPMGHGWRA